MQPIAFITGITGQDGSYLAELLLEKGYQVHGLIRRSSGAYPSRISHLLREDWEENSLRLHYGDITDAQALHQLIQHVEPDEIYNLAAQSHVRISFDLPVQTLMTVGLGALNVLEAARHLNQRKPVRVYQASSSEMFGKAPVSPQCETTPLNPQSPYACAKVYAHYQSANYRQSYGLFTCNGILFNHESPRRDESFVTRKITRAAARIKLGLQSKLHLGNLRAERDWGFAKDYVESMWLMLQQTQPRDYVVATGRIASVQEFVEIAFGLLNLDWRRYVETDTRYLRPVEVEALVGDPSKAKQELGWQAHTTLEQLAELMVMHDLELAQKEVAEQPDHSHPNHS